MPCIHSSIATSQSASIGTSHMSVVADTRKAGVKSVASAVARGGAPQRRASSAVIDSRNGTICWRKFMRRARSM